MGGLLIYYSEKGGKTNVGVSIIKALSSTVSFYQVGNVNKNVIVCRQ